MLRFLGSEGVSKEKDDNEAESHCPSEKYPSVVSGLPSPSAAPSSSADWRSLTSADPSASVRLLEINDEDSLLAASALFLPLLPPI